MEGAQVDRESLGILWDAVERLRGVAYRLRRTDSIKSRGEADKVDEVASLIAIRFKWSYAEAHGSDPPATVRPRQ